MLLLPTFRSLTRVALALSAALGSVFLVTHCGSEENLPIDSSFGGGNKPPVKSDASVGNTSGGGEMSHINDDPNFDPTADGGYWAGYDAGDAGYLADGGPNGGPEVYKDYGHCPEVKPKAFQLDTNANEATIYGADFEPAIEGTINRVNYLTTTPVPVSYLGPFFPLGFIFEPPLPPGTPGVQTWPFFRCKRCLFVPTGDEKKMFISIGGMLLMSPEPNPRSGRIVARMDLVVLIEAEKIGPVFLPVRGGRCLRIRSAPISVL